MGVDTELSIGKDYDTYNTNYADQEYEAGDNWKHGGIAELGGHDGPPDERVTAYFSKASNILYTSYDTACETAYFAVEPCLDKGDMLFIINSYYMAGRYDPGDRSAVAKSPTGTLLTSLKSADPPTAKFESGNLDTIKKIYKEGPTTLTWSREDRFRIILDKNIPFEASEKVQFQETNATSGWLSKRGIVSLFKFSSATTGNYDFVAPCSNRGSATRARASASRATPTTTATSRAPSRCKQRSEMDSLRDASLIENSVQMRRTRRN